jgi:hypothetical protein
MKISPVKCGGIYDMLFLLPILCFGMDQTLNYTPLFKGNSTVILAYFPGGNRSSERPIPFPDHPQAPRLIIPDRGKESNVPIRNSSHLGPGLSFLLIILLLNAIGNCMIHYQQHESSRRMNRTPPNENIHQPRFDCHCTDDSQDESREDDDPDNNSLGRWV